MSGKISKINFKISKDFKIFLLTYIIIIFNCNNMFSNCNVAPPYSYDDHNVRREIGDKKKGGNYNNIQQNITKICIA